MIIKYKKLYPYAKPPFRAHFDDAGADLTAASMLWNGEYKVMEYGTGLAFEIPSGYYAELKPRSSIYKTGMILSNSTGTLDASYRGEVLAKFYFVDNNESEKFYMIGDRIIQMVIPGVDPREIVFKEVETLTDTERGDCGYGSSGK